MVGLNSITGYSAALFQCGGWIYTNNNLYATTTSAAGATGSVESTGLNFKRSMSRKVLLLHYVINILRLSLEFLRK